MQMFGKRLSVLFSATFSIITDKIIYIVFVEQGHCLCKLLKRDPAEITVVPHICYALIGRIEIDNIPRCCALQNIVVITTEKLSPPL